MWYKMLKKIYSEQECNDLIKKSEEKGFEKATVQYYKELKLREDIRNNSRVLYTSNGLAVDIESRLINNLENSFPYTLSDLSFKNVSADFRFYKYEQGEYFKPHKDGYNDKNNTKSLVTVLLYLNKPNGGETVLMLDGPSQKESYMTIFPEAGDILMFEHKIWHEGKSVVNGNKYVLRTDLFYHKDN